MLEKQANRKQASSSAQWSFLCFSLIPHYLDHKANANSFLSHASITPRLTCSCFFFIIVLCLPALLSGNDYEQVPKFKTSETSSGSIWFQKPLFTIPLSPVSKTDMIDTIIPVVQIKFQRFRFVKIQCWKMTDWRITSNSDLVCSIVFL